MRVRSALVLSLAVSLSLPAAANAVVTIGSSLASQPTMDNSSCTFMGPPRTGCGYRQVGSAEAEYASPINGVVVRWRVRTGSINGAQSLKLRVLRAAGGGQFTGVGASSPEPVAAGAAVHSFATRVRIASGDSIGIDGGAGGVQSFFAIRPGADARRFTPSLGDGETRADGLLVADRELLINADVEPDADADGFGDETQDDDDKDGRVNGADNCPTVANVGQGDAEGDGVGDACDGDDDNDGRADVQDNCPLDANAAQQDADADGAGDACDVDDDGDGVLDASDLCPATAGRGSGGCPDDQPVPGVCVNALTGTSAANVLNGSRYGDVIRGRGGNDEINGLQGRDCLFGGAGADAIDTGRGRNRVSAGPGRDAVDAANGRRDTVNCGAGRDRVVADRADRLRRCERVIRL